MSFKDKPLKKYHTDRRLMIDEIHENLIKTMDDKDLHEYYLNNGLLLNQYYKINNENKKITEIDDSNILSFFCKENNDLKQDDKTEEEINTNLHNNNLINQYLSGINDNIYNSKFKDYKNYWKFSWHFKL